MAVRLLFRCDHCQARPDRDTQRTLEGQLHDRRCGAYLHAQPGGWLIWTAGGALGRKRYACPEHRDALIEHVRVHYAAIDRAVWQAEPYPELWPDGFSALDDAELARLLAGGGGDRAPAPATGCASAATAPAAPLRREEELP